MSKHISNQLAIRYHKLTVIYFQLTSTTWRYWSVKKRIQAIQVCTNWHKKHSKS